MPAAEKQIRITNCLLEFCRQVENGFGFGFGHSFLEPTLMQLQYLFNCAALISFMVKQNSPSKTKKTVGNIFLFFWFLGNYKLERSC